MLLKTDDGEARRAQCEAMLHEALASDPQNPIALQALFYLQPPRDRSALFKRALAVGHVPCSIDWKLLMEMGCTAVDESVEILYRAGQILCATSNYHGWQVAVFASYLNSKDFDSWRHRRACIVASWFEMRYLSANRHGPSLTDTQ